MSSSLHVMYLLLTRSVAKLSSSCLQVCMSSSINVLIFHVFMPSCVHVFKCHLFMCSCPYIFMCSCLHLSMTWIYCWLVLWPAPLPHFFIIYSEQNRTARRWLLALSYMLENTEQREWHVQFHDIIGKIHFLWVLSDLPWPCSWSQSSAWSLADGVQSSALYSVV